MRTPFYSSITGLSYRDPDLEQFWAGGGRHLDQLLTALGAVVHPGDRVLKIGRGVGRLTRVLAARGAGVKAPDVSKRMLELARHHNPHLVNVEWILGDGSTLTGIDSGSMDACVPRRPSAHSGPDGDTRVRP